MYLSYLRTHPPTVTYFGVRLSNPHLPTASDRTKKAPRANGSERSAADTMFIIHWTFTVHNLIRHFALAIAQISLPDSARCPMIQRSETVRLGDYSRESRHCFAK